jgi:hypothetical protein
MHEKLITYINSYKGVKYVRLGEMAVQFREGTIPGAVVGGRVDD